MRAVRKQARRGLYLEVFSPIVFVLLSSACGVNGGTVDRDQIAEKQVAEKEVRVEGLEKVNNVPETDSPVSIQCYDERLCWLQDGGRLWKSVNEGNGWQLIYSADESQAPMQYSFIDSQVGWAVSRSGLYRTSDGGHTWVQKPTPINYPNGEVRSVFFNKDGKTGWLAGGRYRRLNNQELKSGMPSNLLDVTREKVLEMAIFRSNDGGETWHQQHLAPSGAGRIYDVKFYNESRGVAVSDTIYYTNNGGGGWKWPAFSKKCTQAEYLDEYYEATPAAIEMLNSELWWVSYSDGRIVQSKDGGRSWCDLLHPGSVSFDKAGREFFISLRFTSPRHGWGIGWDRFLYMTTDGGVKWERVTSDIKFDSLHFLNDKYGLAVSRDGVFCIRIS